MASKLKLRLDLADAGSPGPGSSMEVFRATSEHVTNLGKEGQVSVWKIGSALLFRTRSMAVDIDGAPNAYHPATPHHPHGRGEGLGLDDIRNATMKPKEEITAKTKWVGVVVDPKTGQPITQPNGFYVSPTAMQYRAYAKTDPKRYVDASTIPYLALSKRLIGKAFMGDSVAIVLRRREPVVAYGMLADVAPAHSLGEGSLALVKDLGFGRGGIDHKDLVCIVFPGSDGSKENEKEGEPRAKATVVEKARQAFEAWGGLARVQLVAPFLAL
jgi:hypothetical protein